jgi:hypothetical protein
VGPASTAAADGAPLPKRQRKPEDPVAGLCSTRLDPREADRLFRTAQERLARSDEHVPEVVYAACVAELRRAALAGHREAQYRLGVTVIGFWATCCETPDPDHREEIVVAIAMLRVAARAGHAGARSMAPELAAPTLPESSEPPLALFPRAWVDQAVRIADAWEACHR